MAIDVKVMAVIRAPAAAVFLLTLAACQPVQPSAEDAAAEELRAKGYARAPEITSVTQDGGTLVIYGLAGGGGRVDLTFAETGKNNGGEVNKDGLFRIPDVPIGTHGGLYDLKASDTPRVRSDATATNASAVPGDLPSDQRGRWLHAEGRLFVPGGHPEKAVILRAGGAGRPILVQNQIIAVADYDRTGGLAVAGRVTPQTTVNLVVGGTVIGRSQSDAEGRYQVTGQISPPGEAEAGLEIEITTEKDAQTRTVPVSLPPQVDRITQFDGGWRVDWRLPGGGMQTSVIY